MFFNLVPVIHHGVLKFNGPSVLFAQTSGAGWEWTQKDHPRDEFTESQQQKFEEALHNAGDDAPPTDPYDHDS